MPKVVHFMHAFCKLLIIDVSAVYKRK